MSKSELRRGKQHSLVQTVTKYKYVKKGYVRVKIAGTDFECDKYYVTVNI